MFPGFDGGMEWGGGAADPDGIYYVNVNEIPWIYQMVATRRADGSPLSRGERDYMIHCAACHGLDTQGDAAAGFPPLIDSRSAARARTRTHHRQRRPGRMPAFEQDLPDGSARAILDLSLRRRAARAGISRLRRRGRGAGRAAQAARRPESPRPYAFGGFRRWLDQEGYPGDQAAVGHAERRRSQHRRDQMEGAARRVLRAHAARHPADRHGELRRPRRDRRRPIFIGATADETIRAFDKDTGKSSGRPQLPFGGNATPSIYMVDGRHTSSISAGGGKSGRPAGGSLVAFALPR